jgi:tetratricopeptide (TPR) repeat protein
VLLAALVAFAVLAGVAAALFAGGGESPRDRAGRDPSPTPTAEATRTAEPTPERTTTPEPTATATATPEPTATATPDDEGEGESSGQGGGGSSGQGGGGSSGQGGGGSSGRGRGEPAGDDPTALQLRAFALNNAGDHEQALPYAQKAVRLCEGSAAVSPCAYALFEYAKALRLTGDPQGAIAALEERKQRFPDNQPGAVEAELARARADAG